MAKGDKVTLDKLAERMENGFQQLRQEMTSGFRDVVTRLDAHSEMISSVAEDVTSIKEDLKGHTQRLGRIETKLDDTITRVDDHSVRPARLEEKQH